MTQQSETDSLSALQNLLPDQVTLHTIGNSHTTITVVNGHEGLALSSWISSNVQTIRKIFASHRIILFRGFKPFAEKKLFSEAVQQLSDGPLLNYTEPSTPRTQLLDKIYSSTEYPKDQYIPQHNEHSYLTHWPSKIFFYCEKPSGKGGQTPFADSRKVYAALSDTVKKPFEEKGVLYVRNFSGEMDISWESFFQTSDKSVVADYCRKNNIEVEWTNDGRVRTAQQAQAVTTHPEFGDTVWFNQCHLFHYSNLNPEIAEFLKETYGEENLPRNSYLGDGTSIPGNALDEIRAVYNETQFAFDWQEGDLVMLDNVLYSHGRNPYEGSRSILVAMSS